MVSQVFMNYKEIFGYYMGEIVFNLFYLWEGCIYLSVYKLGFFFSIYMFIF